MPIHTVNIAPMPTLGGTVIDKNTATIAEMLNADTEMRIIPNISIPNSVNYPTIKQYLELENNNNFIIKSLTNTMIVTEYNTGGISSDGTIIYKGDITNSSDFPTSSDVKIGYLYRILTDVTDDDPTKTNTGQSFTEGGEIFWAGSIWADTGSPLPINIVLTDEIELTEDEILLGDNGKKIKNSGKKLSDLGDVNGPATNTDEYVPQWDGTNSKKLKDGLPIVEQWVAAPATSTSTGVKGQKAYDANYLYECVSTDVWVRTAAESTWS